MNATIHSSGEPQAFGEGAFSYIDNVFVQSLCVKAGFQSYAVFEQWIHQQGSTLNPADGMAVVPLITDPVVLQAVLALIDASPSLLMKNIKFHPAQEHLPANICGSLIEDYGCKIVGLPLGSKEYHTAFMTRKIDNLIADNRRTLEDVAKTDIQAFLLFFRNCYWHQQLTYFGRSIHPSIMEPLLVRYQAAMLQLLQSTMCPDAVISDFHKRWLAQPFSANGFSLFDLVQFNLCGYIAQSIELRAYDEAHGAPSQSPQTQIFWNT
jgi:hypothetical protein